MASDDFLGEADFAWEEPDSAAGGGARPSAEKKAGEPGSSGDTAEQQDRQRSRRPGSNNMYGSSYGGYGGMGYGGMGGMYGGMGGYGGMYGGMGGMYGMGGMGPQAESMFRMTQMLEMNSMMLAQLQEHVSMTYCRFRDVAVWAWALKDTLFSKKPAPVKDAATGATKAPPPSPDAEPELVFESEQARQTALTSVRHRIRVLAVLFAAFLYFVLKDKLRRRRLLQIESAWLRAAGSKLVLEMVAEQKKALEPPPPPTMGPDGQNGPNGPGSGGYGMGSRMGYGGYGGMGSMGGYGGYGSGLGSSYGY
eukprot:TRINITY_DN102201_c0_g1_i1.p1 TRINITY_DN102201_c0_g1~~TRINITY_DN102201_c0_g1_i1.p1  ORF type:complete len:307 (-),score=73.79 TRINITY_DN102201_c0_g1_i1:97-1017(-)